MAGHLPVCRGLLSEKHHRHPYRSRERACTAYAELDLAGMARYFPGDGLQVGELRASERFLAQRWRWSKGRVRRFLTKLEEEGRVQRLTSDSRGGIIRLLRYSDDFMLSRDAAERMNHPRDRPASAPNPLQEDGSREITYASVDHLTDQSKRRSKRERLKNISAPSPKRRESGARMERLEELRTAVWEGLDQLRRVLELPGLGNRTASWVHTFVHACADRDNDLYPVGTDMDDVFDLAAWALDDMDRKHSTRKFTPKGFASFIESAIRLRMDTSGKGIDGDDDAVDALWEVFKEVSETHHLGKQKVSPAGY